MSQHDEDDLDLDEFLDQPIQLNDDMEPEVPEAVLDQLVTRSQEQGMDDTFIDDLITPEPAPSLWSRVESFPKFSFVTQSASSLLRRKASQVSFKELATHLPAPDTVWKDQMAHLRAAIARELTQEQGKENPLDRLSPKSMLSLAAKLRGRAEFLDGGEAVLIVRPHRDTSKSDPLEVLELHLHAMPTDSVAFYHTRLTTFKITQGLTRRGLKVGIDYEFVDDSALIHGEKLALQALREEERAGLRIIRKLSITRK